MAEQALANSEENNTAPAAIPVENPPVSEAPAVAPVDNTEESSAASETVQDVTPKEVAPVVVDDKPTRLPSVTVFRQDRDPVARNITQVEQADLAAREKVEPVDYATWSANIIKSGKTDMIGNLPVDAALLEQANNDVSLRAMLIGMYETQAVPPAGVAFTTAEGEFDVAAAKEIAGDRYDDMEPQLVRNQAARMSVASRLKNTGVAPEIIEIISKEFVVGKVGRETGRRLLEAGRFLGVSIPDFVDTTAPAAVQAMIASGGALPGMEEFQAEYAAIAPKWNEGYLTYKNLVTENLPITTINGAFNDTIHDILKEKYSNEQYEDLAFERTTDGSAFALDAEGNKIKREFITGDMANEMMDLSFNSLDYWDRFKVRVFEEGAWALTTGPLATARGAQRVSKILSYKNNPKYSKLLKGVDDPEDILRLVNTQGAKEKADGFFKVGLVQLNVNKEINYISTRLDELKADMTSWARKNPTDIVEVLAADGKPIKLTVSKARARTQAEVNQLKQTRTTAIAKFKVLPYVKDVTESSAIIGIGTHLGTEHFHFMSEDADTREFMSNLIMSLGGYRFAYGAANVTKSTLSGGERALNNVVPSIFQMGKEIAGAIPVIGPILVDKTLKNLETALGRKLTALEKNNAEAQIKLHQGMPPKMRAKSLNAQRESAELHDKIVSRFEGADADRISGLVLQSYGQASGILTLMSAGELNRGIVDIDTLSKYNLADMENNLSQMENHFGLAEMALKEIRLMTDTIDDAAGRLILENWVMGREEGLARLRSVTSENNARQLEKLDDLENYVIKFGTSQNLDEGMLEAFNSYRKRLAQVTGGDFDTVQTIRKQNDLLDESVEAAINSAKKVRDTPYHEGYLNKAIETLLESRSGSLRMVGNEIYQPVREFAKTQDPIDMKPLVDKLVGADREVGIRRFFGPESELYNGREGNQVRDAMENLLHSQFSQRELAELRNNLIDAAETGADKRMYRNMSDLDMGLELMMQNPNFNPFIAGDPYDLEILRRGFLRAKTSYYEAGNNSTARVFGEFINDLDELVEGQSPKYFEAITNARTQYESAVGLPQTEKLILDNFRRSKSRRLNPELQLGGLSLKNVYDTPLVTLFDDVTNTMRDLMMPVDMRSKGVTPESLQAKVDKLVYSLADYRDGSLVFDLTTEKGARKFDQIKSIMTEIAYKKMGDDWLSKYYKLTGVGKPAGISGARPNTLISDSDTVTANMQVKVIRTEGGQAVTEPLLDLDEAIGVKLDLAKSIKNTPEMAEAFKKLKLEFAQFKVKGKDSLNRKVEQQEEALKVIADNVGQLNSNDFVQNFILSAEGGSLQRLKNNVITTLTASGMSVTDATKSFKDVTTELTIKGLFERAGVGAVSGKVTSRAEGTKVSEAIYTPETLLLDLQNEGVRSQLESIIEPDTISFLEDVLQATNDSKMGIESQIKFRGNYLGPGFSTYMSHIWNGLKGVVSPVWIASSYAITSAKAGQISMMKMALQDKDAAQLMHKFIRTPNLIARQDLVKFDNILKNFLFTELAKEGQEMYVEGTEPTPETKEENDDETNTE